MKRLCRHCQELFHPLGDVFYLGNAQGGSHPVCGTHHIGKYGKTCAGVLKKQGLSSSGLFAHPVGDFGDFQHRVYVLLDAH